VVTSRVELTMRGKVLAWLAALAGGAAWLGGDASARLAAALVAAPLLVDLLHRQRHLRSVTIEVAPRRTIAGVLFLETLVLRHAGRRPLRECLLSEPKTMRTEPPALLTEVPSGGSGRISVQQRSLHRSHLLERVFLLSSSWPLGMWKTTAVVKVPAELITEPARVPLTAEVVHAVGATEALAAATLLPGPEFHSLREHLPGEDARAVHALRSAAHGVLVRTVQQGRMPRSVGIVLDLRRPPGRPLAQGSRRLEWSLGACSSLMLTLRARAAEVRVLVLGEEPADLLVQSPQQERELLTLLAEAGPSPHRPLPPQLFSQVQRLPHCFWIPAGSYLAAPEFAAMPGVVTLVGGDIE
jgi:hypothetical protein